MFWDHFVRICVWDILRVITRNVTRNLRVITRNGNVIFVTRNFRTLLVQDIQHSQKRYDGYAQANARVLANGAIGKPNDFRLFHD